MFSGNVFVPGPIDIICTRYKNVQLYQVQNKLLLPTPPIKQGNFELCRIGIVVTLLEKGRVYDKKP